MHSDYAPFITLRLVSSAAFCVSCIAHTSGRSTLSSLAFLLLNFSSTSQVPTGLVAVDVPNLQSTSGTRSVSRISATIVPSLFQGKNEEPLYWKHHQNQTASLL
jgi:hypothetical protein